MKRSHELENGMKADIAVATLSGKAYYLIVNELRKKNLQFLSLIPTENIPVEVKVVITTEEEKHLVGHDKILIFTNESDLENLVTNALKIAEGKESYEKVIIGVDPGEVLGLAVLADGKIIETRNFTNLKQALLGIEGIVRNLSNMSTTSVSVKVGDSAWTVKMKLLQLLDHILPENIVLERVKEAGTSHYLDETKNRRGLRDIVSAIRIAGRKGHAVKRRKLVGSGC